MTTRTRQTNGRTTVHKKALLSTCTALAAQALKLDTKDVSTSLFDDRGRLGISLSVDYPLPSLKERRASRAGHPRETVFQVVDRARTQLATEAAHLCGSEVGAINIRLEGIKETGQEKRVQ